MVRFLQIGSHVIWFQVVCHPRQIALALHYPFFPVTLAKLSLALPTLLARQELLTAHFA